MRSPTAGAADLVVVGTYHWGAAEIKEQTGLLRAVAALGKPLVVVSFMSPYDARFAPPELRGSRDKPLDLADHRGSAVPFKGRSGLRV